MKGSDAFQLLVLTNKLFQSSNFFEIPPDALRSVLVRQESCQLISSTSLLVAHQDSCCWCSRRLEDLIDDRPAALASSRWEEFDCDLWLKIHKVDSREELYQFGTMMQFGTEANWIDFSIKLNVNSCNSYTVLYRLGVIEMFINCLQVIDSNYNEISQAIGTDWYQSRNWLQTWSPEFCTWFTHTHCSSLHL
jgi:hypothetical protein